MAQVLDFVRDGLNETMPEYGGDSNRERSITNAWDYVQEEVGNILLHLETQFRALTSTCSTCNVVGLMFCHAISIYMYMLS